MQKALRVAAGVFFIFAAFESRAQPSPGMRETVEALAHDSTAGRKTPSRELDKAARYIEERLRTLGALPLGDEGGYLQRYPIVESVLSSDSARMSFGSDATWFFGRDYFYAGGAGGDPKGVLTGPIVVVTGKVTREIAPTLNVKNKVVVFLSPLSARGAPEDFMSAFTLGGAGARAVILPGARPDSLWRRLSAEHSEHMPTSTPAWPLWWEVERDSTRPQSFRPILELWRGRWQQFIAAARIDTGAFRNADGSPKATTLTQNATLDFSRRIERVSWPSNVIGLIRGSDPVLRNEYVILTAHYDGLGMERGRPPGPQSVLNGADDNASGVAVMLEVARELSTRRPRRSVIIAAVSGEENGLWGSDYLAARLPVPKSQVVANINMDMIGRPAGDTVYVTGRTHQRLASRVEAPVRRAIAEGLRIVGEAELERRFPGERADERSDHASFRHRRIPSLSFFTGWHADYHETTDDADKVNYTSLQKIANLVRDITIELGNSR